MLKIFLISFKTSRTSVSFVIRIAVTSLTCRGVRRLVFVTPTIENVIQIQKVVMKLVTHFELQKHENYNLLRVIIQKRKKRQRNKRLNLISE